MTQSRKHLRKKNKYNKNKTIKRGGTTIINKSHTTSSPTNSSPTNSFAENFDEKQGIVDIVKDKIGELASSASSSIEDTGLKIIGLERINNVTNAETATNANVSPSIIDKTGAKVIDHLNDVLESKPIQETTSVAAKKTADIISKASETFNNELDNPIVKENIKKSIEHAGELTSVFMDAVKEPTEKLVDIAADSVTRISSAALSGAITMGTDALAATPVAGAVINVMKMLNDGTKAASSIVEAGSEITSAASQAIIETKENMDGFSKQKQMGGKIMNRVTSSIKQFENPLLNGGKKTKNRLIKRRFKTKRVRFTI